jgi:O-antigen/teichoic acid export membrane protein
VGLLSGFLQTMGARLVGLVAAAVGSVVTAQVLGPEGKGVLTVLGTLAGTLVQIGGLGLPAANVHFAARERGRVPILAGTSIWVAVAVGGGMGLLALAVLAGQPALLPGVPWHLLLLTVGTVPFLLGAQLLQNLLLGMEAIRAYNGIELLRIGLGLGVILGLLALGLLTVPSLVLVTTLLAAGMAIITLQTVRARAAVSWRFDASTCRAGLGYGMIFFVNNLLAFLLLKSDFFLVNHFLGVDGVGIYSVSVQIADLLLLAPATLGTLLFPRLSAIPDPVERTRTCLQFTRLAAIGMAGTCGLAGITSPWLIPLLWGPAFGPGWVPLALLLPGIWLLAQENILVMYLAAERLPLVIPGLWLAGLALNIGLNLWWLPRLGLAAAALTSSLAYGAVAAGVFVLFRAKTRASLADVFAPRRAEYVALLQRLRYRQAADVATRIP